ncbi:MAG: arginine--tRNA ligase [Planctomycetota bacterium]|nr:arginine--tRNA ligase [Planctomycetota bacterium]
MTTTPPLHGLDAFALPIRQAVCAAIDVDLALISLERPRQEELGEFALPCFRFAKQAQMAPPALAAKLANALSIENVSCEAVGPFLNFKIDANPLAQTIVTSAQSSTYAGGDEGLTTLVEFSSPNIAKPMHVGHMRTTVIGAALSRIFTHLGHDVKRINHLGDWGSQFGKLVAAWQRWGSEEALSATPIAHLLELYVRYHKEEKEDETLAADSKQSFQELESGEENQTRATWRKFTEISLVEFNKVYARFGIEFDYLRGESWYEGQLDDMINWLDECGVTELSDGATIVNLEEQGIKTPSLVKTAHGTTLYATRDLAAAKSRWEEFAFDQSLYVVGAEQTLHFQQLKAVLSRCGVEWEQRMEHIPFGLIRLTEGKLSTREGRVIALGDVLDRSVELAAKSIEEKNPELPNKEIVAEQIGLGAIVFHDLKHQRQKDVVFDWKEVLSFEGDTGPYLQYTHARCCSILRRAEKDVPSINDIDFSILEGGRELWVAIGRLPQAVREAAIKREPMLIANALLKIAAAGNGFYRDNQVLGTGDNDLEKARLVAIDTLRKTLALGMRLLGVPAPHEM